MTKFVESTRNCLRSVPEVGVIQVSRPERRVIGADLRSFADEKRKRVLARLWRVQVAHLKKSMHKRASSSGFFSSLGVLDQRKNGYKPSMRARG